jgi:hypothetical protein
MLNLTTGHLSDKYHFVYDDHSYRVSSAEGAAFDPNTLSAPSWMNNPKRSHEKALQCIGEYLKGMKNLGCILQPAKTFELKIDRYILDADFVGTWGFKHP